MQSHGLERVLEWTHGLERTLERIHGVEWTLKQTHGLERSVHPIHTRWKLPSQEVQMTSRCGFGTPGLDRLAARTEHNGGSITLAISLIHLGPSTASAGAWVL